jgi:SAM-dependent methyltransferase
MSTGNQMIADVKDVAGDGMGNRKRCPACGHDEARFWLKGPDRFHGGSQLFRLLRCSRCTLVWLEDAPTPHEMDEHYGPEYYRLFTQSGRLLLLREEGRRAIVQKYKSSGAILDLGCNAGSFLATFKGQPWDLYGIEISEDAAKSAEARTGAHIFVGDVLDAPFSPESFDAITSFDVLEHFYQPHQTMTRVASWLKPGGLFIIQVPNIDSGEARFFQSYWFGLELPRHLSHFSPKSLLQLAQSAGLEEVSLKTFPNTALEQSLSYLWDEFLHMMGFSRRPLATAKPASIPWKVFRKILRLSVFPLAYRLVSLKGDGETIRAVFEKPASHTPPD